MGGLFAWKLNTWTGVSTQMIVWSLVALVISAAATKKKFSGQMALHP
jgi:hypothetical protein